MFEALFTWSIKQQTFQHTFEFENFDKFAKWQEKSKFASCSIPWRLNNDKKLNFLFWLDTEFFSFFLDLRLATCKKLRRFNSTAHNTMIGILKIFLLPNRSREGLKLWNAYGYGVYYKSYALNFFTHETSKQVFGRRLCCSLFLLSSLLLLTWHVLLCCRFISLLPSSKTTQKKEASVEPFKN